MCALTRYLQGLVVHQIVEHAKEKEKINIKTHQVLQCLVVQVQCMREHALAGALEGDVQHVDDVAAHRLSKARHCKSNGKGG